MRRLAWVILIALVASCSSYETVSEKNFAYLYDRSVSTIHPEYSVYNVDDQHTQVYFKVLTSELLYQRPNSASSFESRVHVRYEAYADFSSNVLLDSASVVIKDVADDPDDNNILIGMLDVQKVQNPEFILKLTATDLARDNSDTQIIRVKRNAVNNRQDYLVMDAHNVPLFSHELKGMDTLRIQAQKHAGNTIDCRYYNRQFRLPPPAFTGYEAPKFDYEADSTFQVSVDADGRFTFHNGKRGFYHFQVSTEDKDGLTLFTFNDSYPEVETVADMLSPLRYITSLKEFDKLKSSVESKKNIEEFWVKSAGSKERAREVIKAYYSRVENANLYFTSHVEGWRSDRGLIHVIFGMPNVIHKGEYSETWVYGEESNIMSLSFTFVKVKNPFTDNDFTLDRDPLYKTSWYRSVESWRNGRVYN